jgi:DNA-binding transcriptional LysR family regulator
MDTRDLEYFAVIAEHGNVTRASETLDLTPTALSKSLRRLEADVGAKIVERSPRGVSLTAVGTALLARAHSMRLLFEETKREAADLGSGRAGHLRIGAGPTVCEDLPRVYTLLLKEARDLTMDVTITDSDELVPMLRAGKLDLVYNDVLSNFDGIVKEHLYDDMFVVCAARDHPLARRRRLTTADLVGERWALGMRILMPSQLLREAFLSRGLPAPKVVVTTRSVQLRLRLWATSQLLGYMSRHTIREYMPLYPVVELPVKELQLRRQFAVLYRRDGYLSPAAKRFIELMKQMAKKIAQENR